ncbi:MAG: fumarylacetoacetate hydrolase family protein [Acidimicrobiia bacterium]
MSDPRVDIGLERQLRERRELISSGHKPLGWKAGFGAPAAQAKLRLNGPLVGFMTDASVIAEGVEVEISAWAHAVAEPELAVTLGDDLQPRSRESATRAAISAIGPAIELADIDPPPESVEEILAGNIFHKGVVLGAPDPSRSGGDVSDLEARILIGGSEHVRTDRLEELTGRVVDVVSHLSALLADHGEMIRAGEVVICGSVVPAIELAPGMSVGFELHPMAPISVAIR